MLDSRIFGSFQGRGSLPRLLSGLLDDQKALWPDLAGNYRCLEATRARDLVSGAGTLRLQFNPARIVSTAARTGEEHIRRRRCFLCAENLPSAQKGVLYRDGYIVLCNPFPIFRNHFTVAKLTHEPQMISGSLGTLLSLAADLGAGYTVFYNGPKCGASAPDHMHFQACTAGQMPIEGLVPARPPDLKTRNSELHVIDTAGRGIALLRSKSLEDAAAALGSIIGSLKTLPGDDEPLLNLICRYEGGQFRSMIFPRRKFRPDCYYREDSAKVLVSPAAVEMGGLLVLPRESDYASLGFEQAASILREVSFDGASILKMLA